MTDKKDKQARIAEGVQLQCNMAALELAASAIDAAVKGAAIIGDDNLTDQRTINMISQAVLTVRLVMSQDESMTQDWATAWAAEVEFIDKLDTILYDVCARRDEMPMDDAAEEIKRRIMGLVRARRGIK